MTIVRLGITVSADGYVAGPNQSLDHPLGEGGGELHQWAFALRSFREMHGMEGGATGPDDDIIAESIRNIGATIMGRHMFGEWDGPWKENPPWNGWGGGGRPFPHPASVRPTPPRRPIRRCSS